MSLPYTSSTDTKQEKDAIS